MHAINNAKRAALRALFNADMNTIREARADGSWDPDRRTWGRDRRRSVSLALALLNRTPYALCEGDPKTEEGQRNWHGPSKTGIARLIQPCLIDATLEDARELVSGWLVGGAPMFDYTAKEEVKDEQEAS